MRPRRGACAGSGSVSGPFGREHGAGALERASAPEKITMASAVPAARGAGVLPPSPIRHRTRQPVRSGRRSQMSGWPICASIARLRPRSRSKRLRSPLAPPAGRAPPRCPRAAARSRSPRPRRGAPRADGGRGRTVGVEIEPGAFEQPAPVVAEALGAFAVRLLDVRAAEVGGHARGRRDGGGPAACPGVPRGPCPQPRGDRARRVRTPGRRLWRCPPLPARSSARGPPLVAAPPAARRRVRRRPRRRRSNKRTGAPRRPRTGTVPG